MELAGSLIVRRAAERLRPTRAGGAAAARPASTPPQACPSLDREMLRWSAGETVSVPQDATLASLVAAQAQRTPQATALVVGEERLDYATLHRRAAELAPRLAAAGVRRGSVVGLALPRTAALLQAVLAVHLAGGAYLPLDPALPAERLDFMCADAGVQLLLTTAATIATLAPALARLPCRIARLDVAADLPPAAAGTACDAPAPDDLAYVLYTSGSTGRPKGVGVAHRSVVNFLHWARSVAEPGDLAGVLFSTPLGFDIAVLETFLPLAFGGRIVMVENLLALPAAPARATVRLINSVPACWRRCCGSRGCRPGCARCCWAAKRCRAGSPTGCWRRGRSAAAQPVRPDRGDGVGRCARLHPGVTGPAPIGRPICNSRLYVLDAAGALLPPGAAGELCIGGAAVARGYLGRPELTEERFVAGTRSARSARSPDVSHRRPRALAAGRQLEFLGRLDDQVKIRGVRIELGEIEAALRRLPGVAAAAAALRGDDGGPRGLVGWLVAEPGGGPRDAASLRAALREHLPEIMLPASFVWAAALPLTANGKLDRRALSRPPAAPAAPRAPAVAIPTPTQLAVAQLWQQVLQTRELNADDDFFELGGNSLAAVNLLSQVDMRFGVRLATDVLAEGLTVARLARLIEAEDSAAQPGLALALQPLGEGAPFYCLPGIGGDPTHLRTLARRMGTGRPFVALRGGLPPIPDGPDRIEDIAARYVEALLARHPGGPILLGGYSLGAIIAYEMAHQLGRGGERVALLALIDTRRPDWRLTAGNAGGDAVAVAAQPAALGARRPAAGRLRLRSCATCAGTCARLRRPAATLDRVLDTSHYSPSLADMERYHRRC